MPRLHAQTSVDSTTKKGSSVQWLNGTSHDFGKIKQGEPVTCTFEFINTGKEAVTISKGKVECSCMSIAYSDDSVMSGARGEVRIAYNAHTASGFSKSATVVFSNHVHVTLEISGEVIQ